MKFKQAFLEFSISLSCLYLHLRNYLMKNKKKKKKKKKKKEKKNNLGKNKKKF